MDLEVRAEFNEMRETHRRAMERMDRANKRMKRCDQQLHAERKLAETGIKMVSHLAAYIRELKRSQKVFLDSLRNSGNGRRYVG